MVFLDTGWLFEETLAYRDTLIRQLGLRDVRTIQPLPGGALAAQDPDRDLWFSDPDACCRIRKVEPLARALQAVLDAWINGRKRFQGGVRAEIFPWSRSRRRAAEIQSVRQCHAEELEAIYKLGKPAAASAGSPPVTCSVGCMPCSSRTAPDEDARAGRWRGRAKTECGIHTIETS